MRKVHFKTGPVDVFIRKPEEARKEGEINFLEDEWEWAQRVARIPSDPEAERVFWAGVLEKKRDNPLYSVLDDFPREPDPPAPQTVGMRICAEILASLKGGQHLKQNAS